MQKDYYQVLGITKSASKDDIKKAFRSLAHKYHPDKKGGNADKFKEVSEAYVVLSDDKKRAEYDTYGRVFTGEAGAQKGGAQGFGDFGFDFSQFTGGGGFDEFDLGDIFGEVFGGGRRDRATRGRDISIDVEISFEESVFGTERKVLLGKLGVCTHCKGSGGEPGSEVITCKTCNGKGKIRETRRSFLGNVSVVRPCDECRGTGKNFKSGCMQCRGAGVERRQEEISVKVPSGIDDGEMIRMSGMGEAAAGGVSGDLYVKVHVKQHPIFTKDGADLRADLHIKLTTALLGGEHSLATVDGPLTVKIPEGVVHGEILRVRGKGIPYEKGKRGDLLIKLHIEIPRKLSRDSRALVEQLKSEGI